MTELSVVRAVSAGGVVVRRHDEAVEVLLCGDAERGIWALPKGTPIAGETTRETAMREVTEETGLDVDVVDTLGNIEYWFVKSGARVHKTVHFFLMRAIGGAIEDHDPEFDVVEWVPLEQAYRKMSFRKEAEIVRRAVAMFRGEKP